MAFTAKDVSALRERTGCGMMDCKKALTASDGDMEKAIEFLREKGLAAAAKKAGRIAAEGVVYAIVDEAKKVGVVIEVNSETDFVAKNDQFLALLDTIQQVLIEKRPADLAAALACDSGQGTLEEVITNATATIGEKITLRRFAVVEKNDDEFFGAYMHMGGKISVLAKLSGQEDASVAKNIAMQIASMSPAYITRDEIPADVVEHERGVQMNIMKEDPKMAGKSEEMLSKIIEGKISKHFKDQCLMDQEFFLNPDQKVSAFLKQSNASVSSFIRYAVGEGIEKKEENFVEEVMSQIKG